MIVTALAWSGNHVVGRGVAELVPPIGLGFWRWIRWQCILEYGVPKHLVTL